MRRSASEYSDDSYTVTITSAAEQLSINPWTLRAWIDAGNVPCSIRASGHIFLSSLWLQHQLSCTPPWPPILLSQPLLSQEQAAYVAGFLDGEGSLQIVPDKRRGVLRGYTVRMELCNCHRAALEVIQTWFGDGFIREKPRDLTKHKPNFILGIGGDTLRQILRDIYPYLLIKREHADILLEALALNKRMGKVKANFDSQDRLDKMTALHARLVPLNKRGIA
jgi:hypothetical protein